VGTEDFSHIKPVVQSGGGDIQLVSQAWGDAVTGVALVNTGEGNIQPAGLFSTAPYVPSKPKLPTCIGKHGACENTEKLDRNGRCMGCRIAYARSIVRQDA